MFSPIPTWRVEPYCSLTVNLQLERGLVVAILLIEVSCNNSVVEIRGALLVRTCLLCCHPAMGVAWPVESTIVVTHDTM